MKKLLSAILGLSITILAGFSLSAAAYSSSHSRTVALTDGKFSGLILNQSTVDIQITGIPGITTVKPNQPIPYSLKISAGTQINVSSQYGSCFYYFGAPQDQDTFTEVSSHVLSGSQSSLVSDCDIEQSGVLSITLNKDNNK